MTKPKGKNDTLSESCKTHLVDLFVSAKYGRNTDVVTRYTTKGLMVEEDSLTLYSRFKKEFYMKNELRLSNDFITGCPDIIIRDIVKDIKSSWDIYTFFRVHGKKLKQLYYWQMQGYMALTGAKYGVLAYCLIDTPDVLVQDEKRRLQYKMGVIDDQNKTFEAACEDLEKLMKYDDIPLHERVYEMPIERNDADIDRIYEQVKECRKYMNKNLFKIQEAVIVN